jgi:type II secretory pathway component GspD/PulD (secretin)
VRGRHGLGERKVFALREITPDEALAFVSELGLGMPSVVPDRGAIVVTGSYSDLHRAGVLLDLVDTREKYIVEKLAPVSAARTVSTNQQIGEVLGGVAIGTFAQPPKPSERVRAIIDIHGDSVLAIVPSHLRRDVITLARLGPDGLRQITRETTEPRPVAQAVTEPEPEAAHEPSEPDPPPPCTEDASAEVIAAQVLPEPLPSHASEERTEEATTREPDPPAEPKPAGEHVGSIDAPTETHAEPVTGGVLIPQERLRRVPEPAPVEAAYELALLANADDVLKLDLPDRLEMIDLLDLAAKYLNLDCMYEPEKLQGQSITLRLHGKLQGDIRVKDLYPLLESVLKFKGFAMTRHKGNLVTIVPAADALDVDPALVDAAGGTLGAGDMVVTRVFELRYVNAASAMNLLDNMKLSVAASPIEETQTLIVTCYAHRMTRIERLLNMVDRPGRPKEFRFRQLKYTMAGTLAKKVEALVAELQTVPVEVAPMEQAESSVPALTVAAPSRSSARPSPKPAVQTETTEKRTVYLDADERTNRILMIGQAEQLTIVENVIDALDVAQHDPRALKVYDIVHLNAADVKKKLEELEVVGKTKQGGATAPPVFVSKTSSPSKTASAGMRGSTAMEETQVTVLESTNSLLVNATEEQHERIAGVLAYVDVAQQDMRSLKVYELRHVDADEVKKNLDDFDLLGRRGGAGAGGSAVETPSPPTGGDGEDEQVTLYEPQVSVLESTNSLLINATEFQHARIAEVVTHVDMEVRQEAIPYEIYFLENQDPETLAEVLGKLIKETITDKENKIEQTVRKTEDEITIVPDKGTFSLIVYASKKNQDWISKLITALDKRRPQVLIDVTLVEITETDAFTYDLNLIRGWDDLGDTSAVSGVEPNDSAIGTFLSSAGGSFTAFYGDTQIQALLTAVESKNYGRVLAKPKVLVNDNEPGLIKTTDTTYVETRSGIPVSSGSVGNQQNFVETSLQYEPFEAGITLDITPHISEGSLLRLDISLTRSDFLPTEDPEKPPNTTASEIVTAVTVPDGSTIILGGLLKLNQNKGGKKVPILGDVPLMGGLFRSVSNSDKQSKLYVFVKAEIIRPAGHGEQGMADLLRISERDRMAFESHEAEFQNRQDWPGIKPRPVEPRKVLEAR